MRRLRAGMLIQKSCSSDERKKRKWYGRTASCDLRAIVKGTMKRRKFFILGQYHCISYLSFWIFL